MHMSDTDDSARMVERLRIACEMHDLGVAMMRQNLKRSHPEASQEQIEEMLTRWLHTRPGPELGDVSGPGVVARPL